MTAQTPALSGANVPNTRKPLIVALILGAITAGLIVAYLASRDDSGPAPAPIDFERVVVAKQNIAPGVAIKDSMVELRKIQVDALIADPIGKLDVVVGQTARYPVVEGEQFSLSRLVEPPKVKALSFQIPKGMRGFTVPVDVTKSPVSLLAPGDFVDIIATAEVVKLALTPEGATPAPAPARTPVPSNANTNDKPKASVTILENIQVLAIQKSFVENGVVYEASTRAAPPDEKNYQYVTLAVTPEQAQLLWLAAEEGKITLSLRAFGDDELKKLAPLVEPIPLTDLVRPQAAR